jgi:rsbT co-antagonist protein RsbR
MDDGDHVSQPAYGMDAESIQERLAWSGIGQSDFDRIRDLAPFADEIADTIIDRFYNHILSFEKAAAMFADESVIERVKAGQKRYFKELTQANCTEAYIQERVRIGQVHERSGIGPDLYIGAYDYYLNQLGQFLLEQWSETPARAFQLYLSLQKMAHFDMALALETYVTARERTIEAQQREFSELPTPVLKLRDGLLLVPVVGNLDSYRARSLTIELLTSIKEQQARVLVLDITGVSTVDSAVANHLLQTMTAARLMGAYSIVTGISPSVAQALVKIGVNGTWLNTFGDLQRGIEEAERLLQKKG